MAREFSAAEHEGGRRFFACLQDMAASGGIDLSGDKEFILGLGPYYTQTFGGAYAVRAGFEPEGNIDGVFLEQLRTAPEGTKNVGMYLIRHESGILVADSSHSVSPRTGNVTYDYHLRTARTAEQEGQLIVGRAAGNLVMSAETGLIIESNHEFAEHPHASAHFFGPNSVPPGIRELMWSTIMANPTN